MVPVLNAAVRADGESGRRGRRDGSDRRSSRSPHATATDRTGCPSRRSGAKPGRRRRSAAATPGPAGVEDLDQSMLLAAMTPPVDGLVAVEGVVLGAEPGQCFM